MLEIIAFGGLLILGLSIKFEQAVVLMLAIIAGANMLNKGGK